MQIGRYKAIVVDRDNYLLELSRYIHLNPVRAGMVERPEDYFYSSYKSYISKNKDEILFQDLLLGMFYKEEGEAKKRYRRFVESAVGEELENPLKGVNGGIILGEERFFQDVLKRLNEGSLHNEEVSHRRSLKVVFRTEKILEVISKHFDVPRDKLLSSNSGELRKISIYMIKKHTGMINRQIGELFGGISYSAVSKTYQRFLKQLKKDKSLKEKIGDIESLISYVNG